MTDVGPHLLGRVPSPPDARDWAADKLHAQLGLVEAAVDAPAWVDPIQLDQGQTGHCVGFGWAGWGDATPVQDTFQDADGHLLYYECKVIDGDPKGENGSNVRSGAKAMQNRKRLVAYAFASNLGQVDEWLNNHGPVVFGTDWTTDMFKPDLQDLARVHPTGAVEGGHCFLCLDKLDSWDGYLFQNSWGSGWGLNGRFAMKTADLQYLLSRGGEACLAAESPFPGPDPNPAPTPTPTPPPPSPNPSRSFWQWLTDWIRSWFG